MTFIHEGLKTVYDLGIPTSPVEGELSNKAIDLSCRYKISFYDAIYVALSKMVQGTWLTTDEKALKKLNQKTAIHLTLFE